MCVLNKLNQSTLPSQNITAMNPQTLSRREFHRRFAATAIACGPAFAGLARAEPTGKKLAKGRYFDIHTHVGQTWNTDEPLTAKTLLRWMDAHGIDQAVVLPLISPEASSYPLTTDLYRSARSIRGPVSKAATRGWSKCSRASSRPAPRGSASTSRA
jgi:hypothetical protein